jgi:two-component system, NarL family, response regulator NreC
LINAIRTIAQGGQYISDPLKQKTLSAALNGLLSGRAAFRPTNRELEVLEHAAAGRTSKEIAQALLISRRTAEAHRSNVMKKLGLKTQTDLVRYAIRSGIIRP